MTHLDKSDVRILAALQRDGALTQTQLAEQVGLSPSQCSRRLQRLMDLRVIDRYAALLDRTKLGLGVTAYVMVSLTSHSEADIAAFTDRMLRLPQVLECAKLTGDADYMLKMTTTDLDSFNHLITEELLRSKEVDKIQSRIVLQNIKSTTELPLPAGGAAATPTQEKA